MSEQDDPRKAASVQVPAKEAEKKKDMTPRHTKGKLIDEEKEELSEEDKRKKEELELMVARAQDSDPEIQKLALATLAKEIQTSTSSMTSVPKPLKFLRPHYPALKTFFATMPENENKRTLGDILSVLAMTMADEGTRESLNFKLKANTTEIGTWGHEYVRNIAGEIGQEFTKRQEEKPDAPVADLMNLVDQIIPFFVKHNAEPDACDLLMEVEQLPKLIEHVDEANFERVSNYLVASSNYVPEPEDVQALTVALQIYKKMDRAPDALRLAIRLNDMDQLREIYDSCSDASVKQQLAFILGRQNLFIDESNDDLANIIYNVNLSDHFLALARDLGVLDPKTPEDIYKTDASDRERASANATANVEQARPNLASTFVNAFVNAGFGKDKLMTDEDSKWIYKNKEHGMMSAAASLGMILLWDVDGGLTQIDKYLYSKEDFIKAGALLAVGVVNSGVRNICDPAVALLSEELNSTNAMKRVGAILGLGLAYAGSAREDLRDLLLPILDEPAAGMEVVGIAALSLGLIFVGTADGQITSTLMETLMTRTETDQAGMKNTFSRYLSLGLGLVYLAKGNVADVVLEGLKLVTGEVGNYAQLTVETCAYAGSGNVLKVQKFLSVAGEHLEKENSHQGVAVLGLSLVAMGEELGKEMALRTFGHILQYGELVVKRAVPLALGLLYVSDPDVGVMDTLSKLSHDADPEVAQGAILGLGLIGAGTNNARAANLLRNLAAYYAREANHLLIVRFAQGILHLGKGTLSLSLYHSQGILHRVGTAGMLALLHVCLDMKNTILAKAHYLLFTLVCAVHPKMLTTFDQELKPLQVPVRVGHAVDVVGQAGRPKTLTGFQTHTTPVLVGAGERAELATDEYIPVSSVLEGFVILKPNPNAKKPKKSSK